MIEYITKDGDRWDTIAYQVYGDPYLYEALLKENPQYAHLTILPAGLRLKVPILYIDETTEVSPPWQTD